MISMDNRPIEVVQPSSPPPSEAHSAPASPEIRVTDSPPPSPHSHGSPVSSSRSPPVSPPTLATPPMLFQPFLPAGNSHKALPFSIDNILKPSFGPTLVLAAAVAQAQQQQQQRQQQLQQLQQQQQQKRKHEELSSFHPISNKKIKSETSPLSSPTTPSQLNNNNQPVDLSAKQVGSPDSKSSSSESGDKKDGDCPPGMVRGPNGQLWPAWVFCTRYSDRPSSGKNLIPLKGLLKKLL